MTVRYKQNVGVYSSNGFEVYNLWYTYVVMKCFTATTKGNQCIHNMYILMINNGLYTDKEQRSDGGKCLRLDMLFISVGVRQH